MDTRLLELLVCPVCKGPLEHDRPARELICRADQLAYPVRDGIPVMLESEARDPEPAPSATVAPMPSVGGAAA
ncbi:Trm112 family protein [Eleftheria terrae]|uniref:Trm112 family protein n=1 Tax=Eleftheria terrae TaxID=1597781 RepID=UPI00263B76A2|nr:Trm112 family protein [Eleftheria terrae]WKB52843.1 Trm112 family protein [Eleftheria terrae]